MPNTENIEIIVGMGTCGLAAGAQAIYDEIGREMAGLDGRVQLKKTSCIGLCSKEVLVDILMPGRSRVTYGNVTPKKILTIIDSHIGDNTVLKKYAVAQIGTEADGVVPYDGLPSYRELDFFKKQVRIVLRNCGLIDPTNIDEYIEGDGYEALKKVLGKVSPAIVIDIVKRSGIRGRGGGGFPTGMKWGFCKDAHGETKYVICNADEGDPGAFMDRSVLEGDPHAVVEGMIIGAYAIGASRGFIYVRSEYPLAIERLTLALNQAKEKGFLGNNILGSEFSCDIKIKKGAGAFVCGEETALMSSIEGYRGMPRPRPPFPATKGLWGKPTNINNVETFANIPQIILNGAEWFASYGTEKSKGTKVFALTGKVKNTGLAEVPMGITLGEVVFDIGGGILNKRKFKAAQLGGPSGGCIPHTMKDTPIDYDSLIQAGAMMGSGGVVIMDDSTCMVDMARFFLSFTQCESCGKCIPCRVGTKAMLDMLTRITEGKGEEGDIDLLEEIGKAVKVSSLCGLGNTAPNPVLSTIRYFRDEYEAHIKEKRCPAHVCPELLKFRVIPELCTMCGLCAKACPADAIEWEKKKVAYIDLEKCTRCRSCYIECKFMAIE